MSNPMNDVWPSSLEPRVHFLLALLDWKPQLTEPCRFCFESSGGRHYFAVGTAHLHLTNTSPFRHLVRESSQPASRS